MRRYPYVVIVLTTIALAIFASSCTPVCDYPATRVARVRLVNAMPDQEQISIWLNGKLLMDNYPYDEPSNFGYISSFQDGTPLGAANMGVVITSDAAGKDTLIHSTVDLTLNLQTIVVMGRARGAGSEVTRKVLLLQDTAPVVQSEALFRFVHAIPDFQSLDVYWKGHPTPDATLRYGVPSDYLVLDSVVSIKVTEAGNPNNVVLLIPFSTAVFPGIIATAIIRGRSKPIGNERSASLFLLSDAGGGNYDADLRTFGARMMNATRNISTLNLLIKQHSTGDTIRSWVPQQRETVLDIPVDSLTPYLPLRPELNGNTTVLNSTEYYFSTNNVYTTGGAGISASTLDIRDSFMQSALADDRFTFVAIETAHFGDSTKKLDHLILKDTMGTPSDPSFNRVRIVMGNPDHNSITVNFGGRTVTMAIKQVEYFDVPTGSQQLKLSDGTASSTQTISVASGRPMSIYLLPKSGPGTEFPIKTIIE
ncbi:MAG TPA: DUF4397 domain-containing protein [Candidatus Kapabacteria bacterium]|nr:DUF4397 domain-containing protein [Candidatus Kapabacteria bacterium]